MKVAVLGFDVDGRSSYEYYKALGAEVIICDHNEHIKLPEGARAQLGADYLKNLEAFDVLVRTSGMPVETILEANPAAAGKITTQINEFMEHSPTTNIIGVTGTKGKGTTASLITKMLEAAGRTVHLGGNIGIPPLSFIDKIKPDDWVVLELSSFQLSDVRYSPHIGVCLMVVPEHLNWHRDMEDYVRAKSRMFEHQTSEDVAIFFADSPESTEIAAAGAGQKLPFYRSPGAFVNGNMLTIDGQEVCTTSQLKLLGRHNWQNACAAITAVWQTGVRDIPAIRGVLASFKGLEHRLEFVKIVDDVKYYDDSFGTTPETAIVALQAFSGPKIIILGGSDKGANYDELARAVKTSNVRKALLIGDQAPRLQSALEKAGFADFAPGGKDMPAIVASGRAAAQSGDVVLLSTGCASFDMFANYKDRGNQFKASVAALG